VKHVANTHIQIDMVISNVCVIPAIQLYSHSTTSDLKWSHYLGHTPLPVHRSIDVYYLVILDGLLLIVMK